MTEGIIAAIIAGFSSLIGSAIVAYFTQGKTIYRIEQLEKKQDIHNKLIERMYAVEDRCNVTDEKIKVVNHRIEDLENHIAS